MDRINELNELIAGCSELPEALCDERIRKTVKKKAFKHNAANVAKGVGATLAVLLVVFTVCVNTSYAFSRTVSDIPVLNLLARLVSFNKGYEDAVNHKYVTEVKAVGEGDIGTVMVDYVMADERNIVLFSNVKFKDKSKSDEMGYFCVNGMWDTDTGAEIEYSGEISMQKRKKDEYCVTSLCWDGYHRNVKVLAEYCDPDKDFTGTGSVELCFETGECLANKEYNVHEVIDVDGYRYEVTGLRMYPMSTEIDVTVLDDMDMDYAQTIDMHFYMRFDDKLRKRTDGVYLRETDIAHKTFVIESGYYAFDGEFVLGLESVEILPRAYREVELNLETGVLTDAFGIIEDWQLYDVFTDAEEFKNAICIRNSKAQEGYMSFFVNSPSLDAEIGCGSYTSHEDNMVYEYVYLDRDKLDIKDSVVSLIRTEAIYVKSPGWETVIK